MKSKLIFTLGAFFLFLTCCQESFAQKNKKGVEEARINPRFSYSPPARESVANTGLTIALLNPIFIDRDIRGAGSPWSDFAKAMANDVEELLTAKGFKVRGPFNSIDEMVVSDKFNSDFILQITIDIDPKIQRKWQTIIQLLSNADLYKVTQGDVSINGQVHLRALSCFSSEKLWIKDLDINQKNFSYRGSIKWPSNNLSPITELQQEVNLWNPVCKNMEEIYKESFDILYKQFEKAEMTPVAEMSRKADKDRRGN